MSLKTTLIDVDALAALTPRDVLIVDCRFELSNPAGGARDYAQGHVPGAIYASLDRDLSDLSRQAEGLGRHPLPLEAAFSALLSRWGWRDGMQVVAYDAAGGALAAARLWWLLRLTGIPAAVLDGGWAAWTAAGSPSNAASPRRDRPAMFRCATTPASCCSITGPSPMAPRANCWTRAARRATAGIPSRWIAPPATSPAR